MSEILLWINLACALSVAVWYFNKPNGFVELPFLFSIMYLSWFMPQVWPLVDAPQASQGGLSKLLLISLLSLIGVVVGWSNGGGNSGSLKPLSLSVEDLLKPVALLTFLSAALQIMIQLRPAEELTSAQWTGPITILAFASTIGVVPLVASIAIVLHTRSVVTVALALLNVGIYAPALIIYFRRAEIFEFALAVLLGLVFVQKRRLPRLGITVACIAGFFLVHGVGELRQLGGAYHLDREGSLSKRIPSMKELLEIDWAASLAPRDPSQRTEVRNALETIEALDQSSSLTLGGELWNTLVNAYVPGQIIGVERKRDLLIGDPLADLTASQTYYRGTMGVTMTGFPHVFRDFWFLGFLVFWLTGVILGHQFRRAKEGALFSYLFYGSAVNLGIHTLTHSGYYMLAYSVLPIVACAWLARTHSRLPGRGRTDPPPRDVQTGTADRYRRRILSTPEQRQH